jgi:ion channel-forming bestrophin family protein
MYVKRNYGFLMTFNWSKMPFIYGGLFAAAICSIDYFTAINLSLPWQPISILGIAVAFYLGFKNNSSYDRTWEARKIWGGIVNHSRTFGTAVITMIDNKEDQKRIIYRHIAWLTALRYQLRLVRAWEHVEERENNIFQDVCSEYHNGLGEELMHYISREEFEKLKPKTNIAAQLLLKQNEEFAKLNAEGRLSEFKQIRLHEITGFLYDEQGKSERIKNFPFPRQYASTAIWLNYVFAALIPFGILDFFAEAGNMIWMSIPFSGLIIWVFFLMEKIGDYSENPFEGTYNDVPISSISRGIEIDLREMINDENIPEPVKEVNGFLM